MSSLAGYFLVARPVMKDGNFAQSVVLLLQHGPEGAFGLVLNRPVRNEELPFPVYLGGPCKMEGMILLHGQENWLEDTKSGQVCPGVYIGDSQCAERVTDPPPGDRLRFKMFAGYSGWGPQQLEGELVEGAWALVRGDGKHVFDTPPEDLWERVVPPTIPQPSLN